MARRRPNRLQTSDSAPAVNVAPPSLKTAVLFLAIALYLGGTVFKLCMQEWNLYQQARILQAEKEVVLAQRAALDVEIAQTKTNAGIERLAREQLGLVMASEIPVKTTQAPPPKPVVKLEPPTTEAKPPASIPPAMAALAKIFKPFWDH